MTNDAGIGRGLLALRCALADVLDPCFDASLARHLAVCGVQPPAGGPRPLGWLYADAVDADQPVRATSNLPPNAHGDADLATSSAANQAEGSRLIALVELARNGDKDAFGQLYDHYHGSVYRFLYYRVSSVALAEDLTGETFFRALRGMNAFRWQGKDFGAWLMTIARNLAADHFKASRTRLEQPTEDMATLDLALEGPELEVLASLTNQALLRALGELPTEQRECLIMRFLQGLSIAETAEILGRSPGAVKQLQLRGVRNLAKLLPEEVR